MRALAIPPAGSRVRVVTRQHGEFYGDIIPATLKSGRVPIAPWGVDQTTLCIAPSDIAEIEAIEPTNAFVFRVIEKQRAGIGGAHPRGFRRAQKEETES